MMYIANKAVKSLADAIRNMSDEDIATSLDETDDTYDAESDEEETDD